MTAAEISNNLQAEEIKELKIKLQNIYNTKRKKLQQQTSPKSNDS